MEGPPGGSAVERLGELERGMRFLRVNWCGLSRGMLRRASFLVSIRCSDGMGGAWAQNDRGGLTRFPEFMRYLGAVRRDCLYFSGDMVLRANRLGQRIMRHRTKILLLSCLILLDGGAHAASAQTPNAASGSDQATSANRTSTQVS